MVIKFLHKLKLKKKYFFCNINKMDEEEEYFDNPLAYIVAFASLFVVYLLIIVVIYIWRRLKPLSVTEDRQANTLAEETARDNRFNDIFFIEPNSAEAARIRAQLEKDDKDLPSYDEVMRMTDLATPTAATATNSAFVPAISASSHSIAASSTSVNTTDTTLTVPPYTETGANVSSTSSIPRPLTPPPYSPEPPAANCVVLPITTPLHATTTQSS